jgi:hypothetical protein
LTLEWDESYIINLVPCPNPWLSTLTVPPIFSMMFLQILSPKPVP